MILNEAIKYLEEQNYEVNKFTFEYEAISEDGFDNVFFSTETDLIRFAESIANRGH